MKSKKDELKKVDLPQQSPKTILFPAITASKLYDESSPVRKTFQNFKQKYQSDILFFRMGEFYETFYEDAEICSKVLGLELISRDIGEGKPVPLAGVPWYAINGYLKKMLRAGYKVAVFEQIEDPKTAKRPVKRDMVRIITPGKPKGV
jgi:DNA mismatch repair protein MutS